MTIDGKETLYLTLAFVVPGFIWHYILTLFQPSKTPNNQMLLLRFLALSCFNYAIWSWLVFKLINTSYARDNRSELAWLWTVIIFISPAGLGLLTGCLNQIGFVRIAFNKMGLIAMHSIPTAWDYKFFHTQTCVWVQIHLKNGKMIAGLYGSESFASSDPEERDLYLQKAVRIDNDGNWVKLDRSDGVLIKGDMIEYIEFIRDKQGNL